LSWSPDGSRVTAIATDAATSVDRVVVLDPSAASSAAVELDSPDGREIRSSSWDRRGALYVQTGTGESTAQFLVDEGSRRATRIEAASCCRLLAALGDGGFVGLSPVDGDERKALVRVDAAFAPVEVLARAQGSRAGMPAADECGGTYLLGTRVSPDGRVVAFAASASYGPRCEVLAD
jgi:hypothetical protein